MLRRDFLTSSLTLAAAWPWRGYASALKPAGDLAARSLDGAELALRASSVEAFAASLHGGLLLPVDAGYDKTRRIWNAAFDKRPAMIARCSGASDVVQAVNFAREHRLLTAVRAGGHSLSGKSTCEGGLMIDLQPMRGVRVDPRARRAWLEGGSLLLDLDREAQAFGLVTTAGTVGHTGAAGLTLGGGFGRLGRRFGMSCDNVASFDVVTADGRFLRASDTEHQDLYWGLRGGGGNFGVVTSFEYRLHPMDPVILAGHLFWPIERAREVMRMYRDLAPTAPEHLHLELMLNRTPDGPLVGIEACWSGEHGKGLEWLKALRAFGPPTHDSIGPMPYVKLQTSLDEDLSAGRYYYTKSGFLDRLTDDGMDAVLDVFLRSPAIAVLFFDQTDGAYHRVAADATAFPHRSALFWLGIVGIWPEAPAMHEGIAQIRAGWRELEPLTQGFYTNLAGEETTAASYRENYGRNFERLVALKAKYDPMNLFRLNANVPPSI